MTESWTNARGNTAKRYTPPSCICCGFMGAFFEEVVTGYLYCADCWYGCADECRLLAEVNG